MTEPAPKDGPPPRMPGVKPRFFERLAPWIGALIVVMGASQAGLVLAKGGKLDMRMLGTGLLITGGGLGLIARRTKLSPAFFAFTFGALAVAAGVVLRAHPL